MPKASNWKLTGYITLALFAMVAGILLYKGSAEAGVRMVIRATARTSLILFLLAFSASSLRRLWQSAATAWLLRNRRYVGVSFAVSHFLHLSAIGTLAVRWPHPFVEQSTEITTTIGGGLAYLLIAAMVATSFDRSAAWLGARRWRLLHTVGNYYVLGIFTLTYLPRALKESAYLLTILGIGLALLLRIVVALRRK
jgi:hypothetical protein